MRDGSDLIANERARQIIEECFSNNRDDQYTEGQLLQAAECYMNYQHSETPPVVWPAFWSDDWWKPSEDQIRNLAKAGALIAAEIDRLKRARDKQNEQT